MTIIAQRAILTTQSIQAFNAPVLKPQKTVPLVPQWRMENGWLICQWMQQA